MAVKLADSIDEDEAWFGNQLAPPPRPLTHREFARTLRLPDGPAAGQPYDPESEPAQSVITDVLDAKVLDASGKPFRDIVYVAATQTGKSLVGVIVPAMRAVIGLRQPCIYCLPTGDLISKIWTTKLLPSLHGCGLGDWLPDTGPGSRGGKAPAVPFFEPTSRRRAGAIIFIAGGEGQKREAGQASVTAGVAVLDEVDEYETSHRVALMKQRVASYGSEALIVCTSTVKKDAGSVILGLYAESTQSRLWFACPHCHRYQALEWENVRYEGTDDIAVAASARYFCIHCGVGWTDPERHKALSRYRLVHAGQSVDEAGRVSGEVPRSHTLGLRASKLDYHLGFGLAELSVEHRRAKSRLEEAGDHGLMRSFYRDRLSREYTAELEELEAGKELTWQYLLQRSHRCAWGPTRHVTDRSEDRHPTYSRHVAEPPPECQGTVGGVDVQHDRLYWVLVAFTLEGTTYDVAWGYEYAREDRAPYSVGELHRCLDRVDGICRDYSAGHPFLSAGLDTGDQTDALMSWLKGKGPIWKATKGASGALKDEPGDIPGLVHRRDGLYHLATDALREAIHSAYRRPNGETGACHLPSGLQSTPSDTAYLRHLCAERQVLDPKTRKFRILRGPGRWDWQDARRIAEAMLRLQLKPKPRPIKRHFGVVGKF